MKSIPILLQSKEYRHFKSAVLFCLILATCIAIFLLIYGKEKSFLIVNQHYSSSFDFIFSYWTYLGDGIIWIPLFAYAIIFKRDYLVVIIAGLLICTVLTQFLKQVVFWNDYRPIVLLPDKLRNIPGYFMNRAHSFPSGHTSTAFTLALLMSFIVRGNFGVYFFPIVAFFVGYSRVYLAQHFVTDVLAGVFVGIISSWLALIIFQNFMKRKGHREDLKRTKS